MSSSARKLQGKVAIVTASTDGIGYAIAKRLAEDGASVMISSRKQKNVDAALEKLKSENVNNVAGVVCHVGKEEHRNNMIQQTIEKFGGIDILVSNAGINPVMTPLLETSEVVWDKVFDINVKAGFLLVKETVPHIEKRGGGSIVLVSSVGGFINETRSLLGAYSISKTAMLGLTKALVPECADKNIRINTIAPGLIQTRMSEALWKEPMVNEAAVARIPMERLGKPSECAGPVSFLCSDDASYITGETIVMAGGVPSRL